MSPTPAGWFPDPTGRFENRYWDGAAWTKAVMRGGAVETDADFVPEAPKVEFPSVAENQADPLVPGGGRPYLPPSASDRFTSLSVSEAQPRVAQMLLAVGATVMSSSPGRIDLSVTSKGEPNILVTILLACICIVPAIIYWISKSKPQVRYAALTFVSVPSGTRIGIQADPAALVQLAPALAALPL